MKVRHFVHNSSHLERSRHNVFYYRWPLPTHLQRAGKSKHVKVSLRTCDHKEALQLSRMLGYHASVLIEHEGLRFMDYGDIRQMVQDYFYDLVNQKKAEIHKTGPLPEAETWRLLEQMEQAQKAIDSQSDIISSDDTSARLQPILNRYDVEISPSSPSYETLKDIYKRAFHGYCQKLLSHNQKQLDFPFTTAPAYMKATQIDGRFTKPENRLERVIDAYIKEMERTNNWGADRSKAQVADSFAILTEILGKNFNTPQLDYEQARMVKELLIKIPSNRNKKVKTRGLPLLKQIEVDDMEKLSIPSINKSLTHYSGLLKWAKTHGYTPDNPFEGMMLKNSKEIKKEPFNREQVRLLLAEVAKDRDGLAKLGYQKWSVLIGLYTGARQNEIASLTPADIKQDDDVWYFDINDEEETKRLKTKAATRRVPIHSELLHLGILEYREQGIANGHPSLRLLQELTYENETWGRKIGRWFNGPFLTRLNLKTKKLTYHSLRHTAITTMRQSGIDNHIVRALVGHEADGVTEAVYNAGFTLKQLQTAVETIKY